MLSKTVIFIILTFIAALFGILAVKKDATFQTTLWSQLFWLSVGTIATTFLLNAILERDLSARRRREDQFAFRTFTATILSSLLAMIDTRGAVLDQLVASALASNKKFAEAARNTSTLVAKATVINPESYDSHYLDVASHLRDLANRFIRLYSKSQQEMLEHYQNLQGLARRWIYRDVFAERSMVYTSSLDPTDPIRQKREAEFSQEIVEVQKLLNDTASYLSDLAGRVATGSGIPAVS